MQISLRPADLIPMAGGRVTVDSGTREIRIIATGLPDIETVNLNETNDRAVYQVWWLRSEELQPAKLGVLTPGLDKTHFLNVVVSRETLIQITGILVTIENQSGIVAPSDRVVLTAEVPKPLQNKA
ncbi:MAG: hypothetical protein SCK28_06420 [Bacillota bacterium]|nr:hypothetical protein [Bacillota bacterium]